MTGNSESDDECVIKDQFEEIRSDLNLDQETAKNAWSKYQSIGSMYSLEVCLMNLSTWYSSWICLLG